MKKLPLIFLFFIGLTSVLAQKMNKLDSLVRRYENQNAVQLKKTNGIALLKYLVNHKISPEKEGTYVKELKTLVSPEPDSLDVEVWKEISRIHTKNYHFDAALECIRQAQSEVKKLPATILSGIIYDQTGYIFFRKGNMDSAYYYNLKASEIINRYDDPNAKAVNLFRKGVFTREMGKYDKATEAYLQAVRIYEKLGNMKYVSWLYENIGNLFIDLSSPDKAMQYFEKGLQLAIIEKDSVNIAGAYNNIGRAYHRQAKDSMALIYYHKAMKINEAIGNQRWLAYNWTNIGLIHMKRKEYEKAIDFTRKAIELKLKLGDQKQLATSYGNLGDIYKSKGMLDKSVAYYDSAVNHIKNSGIRKNVQKIFFSASKANYLVRQYKRAYELLMDSYQQRDSILAKEKIRAIHEIETQYQTAKKEQQIKDLKHKQEVQKFKAGILGGGLVASGIIIVLILFFFYQKRKKDSAILKQKELVFNKEKQLTKIRLEKAQIKEAELQKEITFKSKQLTTHALHMMQKNQLLQQLKSDIKTIAKHASAESKQGLKMLVKNIERALRSDNDWDVFKKYFVEVNQDFYHKLTKINPEIKGTDLKIAALIKLNLNIKESASILNIEPNSIKSARYRLRKKLGLKGEESLGDFIRKL